jgi:hypothetical protein
MIPDKGSSCARIPKLLGHDHSELDELLDRFFAAAKKRYLDESFDALDVFWARLAVHIRAEHLHLFPTLIAAVGRLEKAPENVRRPPSAQVARDTIARLREDHDFFMQELAAAVTNLRKERGRAEQSTSTVLSDVTKKTVAVRERLQTHNALEESEVYRWAEALLEDTECIDLNTKMNKELENLPNRLLP